MTRMLKHPACIFILLGTLVFIMTEVGSGLFNETGNSEREFIRISSQELVDMTKSWERTNRTEADPAVLNYLVDNMVYNEVLCREALKLDLHQTDTVVWQRLVQNMRFVEPDTAMDEEKLFEQALSLDMHLSDLIVKRRLVSRMERFIKRAHAIEEPEEADIDRFIKKNSNMFAQGGRLSFSHVFLVNDGRYEDAEKYGTQLLKELRSGNTTPEKAYRLGDMFPISYFFKHSGLAYIRNTFGKRFIDNLLSCETGIWCGPFKSNYGIHLVRVEERNITAVSDLPENRGRARNCLMVEKEKELIQEIVEELRNRYYTVLIDGVPVARYGFESLLDV